MVNYILQSLFFALSIILYYETDFFSKINYMCVVILIINLKFTGLFYVLFFMGFFLIYLFFLKKVDKIKKNWLIFLLSLMVGIIFFGFNPYVKNTITYGNLFYPLAGKKTPFPRYDGPKNFSKLNNFEDLFFSIFTKSEHTWSDEGEVVLKKTFFADESEWQSFVIPDTSIGGWGPLYGASIIFSMVILLVSALNYKSNKKNIFLLFSFILILLLSVIIKQHSYYARYNQQFWIFSILPMFLYFYEEKKILKKILFFLSLGTILILFINNIKIADVYFKFQINGTKITKNILKMIKEDSSETVVYFGSLRATRIKFQEMGVIYKEVKLKEQLAIRFNTNTVYRYFLFHIYKR